MSDAVQAIVWSGVFTLANTIVLKWSISRVHKDINGRMTELLGSEKEVSRQQGKDQQRQIAKDEAQSP